MIICENDPNRSDKLEHLLSKKLWYSRPAKQWLEALPIGNGRLGGMVFGGIQEERIQLNEDSIYYGGPKIRDNPDALSSLPKIRQLLKDGKLFEAEQLAMTSMVGIPRYLNPYQPLADLFIRFMNNGNDVGNYCRELDLEDGIVYVHYEFNNRKFTREYFSSFVDQVLMVRLTSDHPNALSLFVNLMRRPFDPGSTVVDNKIIMEGRCGEDGIKFCTILKAISEDGEIFTIGDSICAENTSSILIILAAETTFYHPNPRVICEERIRCAEEKSYDELKQAHIKDYRNLFGRVDFSLKGEKGKNSFCVLPTDERLRLVKEGRDDIYLIPLYFNYGRYLLLSSSRVGSLPANLQGIWNESFSPPWESGFTININLEMNYWPAEACNLQECQLPLFNLLERMDISGRQTAINMYGSKGVVAHHNTNIWGDASPTGRGPYIWPMGFAWLCLHLWEHFLFSMDKSFLSNIAYPLIREAVEFFLDYLIMDEDGYLITGLSQSPENIYKLPNGEVGSLSRAPAMDSQILYELFTAYIKAEEVLGVEADIREKVKETLKLLPPHRRGSKGQLLEWDKEYEEIEPGHRHLAHLFALYPGKQISPGRTPELANAARIALENRIANGSGSNSWSRAWIINLWARLGEGALACESLLELLKRFTAPNLFSLHPPGIFQIDGNFGGIAGIAEMLLQSHEREICLLPALPDAWVSGYIRGLRVRGGFEVDIYWDKKRLEKAIIYSVAGERCRVKTDVPIIVRLEDSIISQGFNNEFDTESGKSYILTPL